MPRAYSPAALDLGLGEGDQLRQQTDDEELKKKKKLGLMASQNENQMGLAAMNLLGMFRGQ